MDHPEQLPLFLDAAPTKRKPKPEDIKAARSGTFTDNLALPIHRWFRYSAGFSAEWAKNLIVSLRSNGRISILDPFAGSGTALIAAEKAGVEAFGFESHPFMARIAGAKLLWKSVEAPVLIEAASKLVERARNISNDRPENIPPLLAKCYAPDVIVKLFSMREAFLRLPASDKAVTELLWLAITAILRSCSHVGTAQWQYVLPKKRKMRVLDPFTAFQSKIREMADDIRFACRLGFSSDAQIFVHDARKLSPLPAESIDLVITSPPYPNNYDYADATRLEMTFWGEVESWGDLQKAVRQYIVRSCSQHTAAERLQLGDLLELKEMGEIADELAVACRKLETVRHTKGGRKTYHTMVAAYFADLSKVFRALRPVCKTGARLCFVVGDSAPYGVYIPVDKWLGRLAVDAGFNSYSFEKIRDRNVKWKNRKHTVPLHEGRLWVEG
jgi:DNA modification methylase